MERFRLTPDGKNLHWTQDVEDPQVLNNHGTRYSVMERREGYNFPYECDPSYGQSIEQRGGQAPADDSTQVGNGGGRTDACPIRRNARMTHLQDWLVSMLACVRSLSPHGHGCRR